MAKAKYATDSNGEKLYLIGHTKAVYDETGTLLEDRLKKSEDKVNKLKDVALSGDYNDLTNKPASMKPTSHASASDIYGKGDSTNYGHVKLSSSTNSTSGTSSGEAATPSAVKAAYDLANSKADAGHTHSYNDLTSKPSLLQLGTSSTTAYRGDLGQTAYTHSQAVHAPSNSERNVVVGIQRNGVDVTPNSLTRKVDIIVPTTATEVGAAAADHKHTKSEITDFPTSMTPTSHASTNSTYGAASSSNYGHIRLSDSTSSSSSTSGGYAATPYAVKQAYDKATEALNAANSGGAATSANKLTTPRAIDGVNFDGSGAITHYGVCSTAGDTAAKTVSISGFNLSTGAVVFVKFTNKNTVNSPTLNVNGTGAASMRSQGGTVLNKSEIRPNILYMFVYDGTDYRLVGTLNHGGSSSVVIGQGESEYSNTTVVGGEENYAGGYSSTIIGGRGNRTYAYQTKVGFYATEGTDSDYFVVGNGSITGMSRSNAFRVDSSGKVYGKAAVNTTGADYAELFEWLDGNPEGEDRIGLFVTLDGEKIRLANADDDYILGAISGAPGVVGNNHADTWKGMWLTDIYGRVQKHTVHVDAKYDDEGIVICEAHDVVEPIVNPDYNADEKYVPREDRPEWGIVGMMGQLIVIDDGTCEVNGCCKVADGGKATASESGWRVLARLDETHVKVLFR